MPYPATSLPQQFTDTGHGPSELGKRTDDQKAKDAEKYLSLLAQYRLLWEPMIDNIIAYVDHGRRSVQDKDLWPGQQTGQFVFDDSAMLARNTTRDGMAGAMCSRNLRWFSLTLPTKVNFPRWSGMRTFTGKALDEIPEVARWLQYCEEEMYSTFNQSNFYDVITEFISDGIGPGTAYLIVEEETGKNRIVFTVPHFRECYIAENQHGFVDTVYRVYKVTLRQLADKFGMDRMKEVDLNFENQYKSNMHEETEILHAVYPRKDYFPGRIDAKSKKWESIWVYRQGGKLLAPLAGIGSAGNEVKLMDENGYDSMPIITWRWRKNNDELYGRSPAWDAFVTIARANSEGRSNIIAGQKLAEPPLVAYSDLRGAIQKGPNGITFMEANRGDIRARAPMPLNTGIQQNLPFSIEIQKRDEAIINQFFHTDVFMLLTQLAQAKASERMVTEQVFELMNEKAAILGTRVGRLQSEGFDPLIFRVFDIKSRAGRMPDPPSILLETIHGPVEVQYLGPLAQAQTRLSKVRAIQAGLQIAKQVSEVNPIAMDKVDFDELMVIGLEATGFPATCIRTDEMVSQIRDIRNKKEEQREQIEAAPKLAKAAAALSKTTEEGSPLKALIAPGGEA